jgi:hypothetical protein
MVPSDESVAELKLESIANDQSEGTSMWEISRFCIRQCIELNLHTKPSKSMKPIDEQHRRRIYWECFIFDRFCSGMLGRPFAIADSDIETKLPINVNDERIQATGAESISDVLEDNFEQPTEVSALIFNIRLRCITSKTYAELYPERSPGKSENQSISTRLTTTGQVYVKLSEFLQELDAWRHSAPIFPRPRCLYKLPEWYDFLLEKDKLLLIRGAMHMASRRNNLPPRDLLDKCLDCAMRLIEIYAFMMEAKKITWTKSYFQSIFTADLSIIYCVSLGIRMNGRGSIGERPIIALALCSGLLRTFKENMPDIGSFAVVFEILKDDFVGNMNGNLGGSGNAVDSSFDFGSDRLRTTMDSQINNDISTTREKEPCVTVPLIPRVTSLEASTNPIAATIPNQLNDLNDSNDSGEHSRLDNPYNPTATIGPGYAPLAGSITSDISHHVPVIGTNPGPSFTDEVMEQLELGFGEYAWGYADIDFYPWNQLEGYI